MRRLMRRLMLLASGALLAGGCGIHFGPQAERMTLANAPGGTTAEIVVRESGEVLRGELLEVRADALVVLIAGRVTIAPVGAIRRATFHGSLTYLEGGAVHQDARTELRLLSRYPNGISAEVMTRLLAAYGQTEPRVIVR